MIECRTIGDLRRAVAAFSDEAELLTNVEVIIHPMSGPRPTMIEIHETDRAGGRDIDHREGD